MRGVSARALGALAAALVVALAPAPGPGAAALLAGAASVEVSLPAGTPLGGYGGFPRRAVVPDVLGRFPHAFWFTPSTGVHDPLRARGLVLERGTTRVLWLAVDLVGTDPGLVAALRERLQQRGLDYSAIVVSASHTHSGPGAFADSEVFGFIALDRLSPGVRSAIVDGLVGAAREAEARKVAARTWSGRAEVRGITDSRVDGPLDPELAVLKVTDVRRRPVALLWNYAIHGTAVGRDNSLLSGDLMADASARIERELGVPALFINGAVGDVSPRPRGWAGVEEAGRALAAGALAAWRGARPEAGPRLAVAVERVTLPSPALSLKNCLGAWIPSGVTLGLGRALPASAELTAVAVGDTALVTIPGELETSLGLDVKAAAKTGLRRVLVAGVSNDYLGYFLTPVHYRHPSYIACGSLYGERGGEIIRDGAIAALRRLNTRGDGR